MEGREREMGKLRKRGSQGEREGKESGPGSCVLTAQRASLWDSSDSFLPPCLYLFLSHIQSPLSLQLPSSLLLYLNLFFLVILKKGHFLSACVLVTEWRKSQHVLLLSTVPVGQSPFSGGYQKSLFPVLITMTQSWAGILSYEHKSQGLENKFQWTLRETMHYSCV